MINIFEKVIKFCQDNLWNDQDTISYLKNRDISDESISKFEIGLFPQDLRLLFDIVDPVEIRKSGIISNASFSTFKNQDLVFPIKDVYGNYIAIAGRTRLNNEQRKKKNFVKYMNSSYKKSYHLFGLNLAKLSILKERKVFVVEGYFDVISPFQKGLTNIVSVCGGYLSVRQIALLSRFTNDIIIVFDNEEEAQIKASKIVDKRNYDGIKISYINPLKGTSFKDIDEFLLSNSIDDFLELMKGNEKCQF